MIKTLFKLLLMAACLSAHAEQTPQELYLNALQSIAEGRQMDASEALLRMIEQEPQHAGAWLDLAIIQCELGREAEAERLFSIIESRFAPPPVILEVIASQRAKGCKAWKPQTRLSVMAGRGTDSNVNQGASNPNFTIGSGDLRIDLQLLPESLPQRDQYTVVSAEYMRELTSNGTLGFLQMRAVHNDNLTKYDTSSVIAGAEHPWRLGGWNVRGTGLVAAHSLGGRLYQSQTQAQARITPPWKLPNDLQLSMITGLSHVEYLTLKDFNANVWELRGQLTYRAGKMLMQASAGYQKDRATSANRLGGDRAGWFASLQGRIRIADWMYGDLGWTRQTWLSESPYSPGLIDEIRHQKTQVLRGALIFPLTNRQSLQIELRQVRNDENISVFQYNSRQLQVSWQWQDF